MRAQSRKIVEGKIKEGQTIKLKLEKDKIVF